MAHQTPPILFLIFSRPSTTEIVFEEIRKAKPRKLFVAADGPRKDRPDEKERCEAARKIISKVDWDCEVKTLFRDENLGCGRAISEGITWFFEHVDEGIILEDDTKPAPEFFRVLRRDARALPRRRSGDGNKLERPCQIDLQRVPRIPISFLIGIHIWGWATWKRAWKHYDYSMKRYPEIAEKGLLPSNYTSIYEQYYMEHLLDRAYYENDRVTWWGVQWGFARKINSGLASSANKKHGHQSGIWRGCDQHN